MPTTQTIKSTAYLVLLIKSGKLVAAKITSEPAYSLSHSFAEDAGIWATAAETSARSFQEAHDELRDLIRRVPNLRPLLPFFAE